MSGILRLESLTKGNTLKQGDKTPLKYRLFDADGEKLNIAGKSAQVRLVYPDFLTIGYEKAGLTVAQDDTVTFTIDSVIPSRIYHVEIIVDDKFIFPSRADESKFTVDKSSLGTEANIIEIIGVDAVVRKAVDLINEDPNLIIDEDKLVNDVIANTGLNSIDEYYQQFNEAIDEFTDLKPKAVSAITKSDESLTKSQNALSVANGIDAKATSALSLSESADTLSKSVQEQFNQVVIDGDSSVEAAQARVDASGQTNASLKERLDKEHNEVTTQVTQSVKYQLQPDFVDLIRDMTSYNNARLRKRDGKIEVFADNGQRHVTFDIIKDVNDDFWKLSDFIIGGMRQVPYHTTDNLILTGNFSGVGTTSNVYTSEIGASFECVVRGDEIRFLSYVSSVGGVWEFVIDENTETPKVAELSTYHPTNTGTTEQVVTTGLNKDLLHTVRATYKGNDPVNPSPVGNGRGWVRYYESNDVFPIVGFLETHKINNLDTYLSNVSSNKDFAFSIDVGDGMKWSPEHNGIGTVYNSTPPAVYIDGVAFDLDTLSDTDYDYVTFTDFAYVQKCVVRHSGVSGDIAEITFQHHFDKSGVLSISGSFKALRDLVVDGYPIMLPLAQNNIDEIVTSLGSSKVSLGDNSYHYFESEEDNCLSVAGVSSTNKDWILATSIVQPLKTMRFFESDKILNRTLQFWQRSSSPKLYFKSLFNTPMVAGESYSWQGKFAAGEIKDIYNYVK